MKKIAFLFFLLLLAINGFAAETDFDFELYNLGDTLYDTQQIRALPSVKLIAVDFFSIHCEPCKKALPDWIALYKEYHPKGLEVIVVVLPVEDDREKELQEIERFFQEQPSPFPIGV